MSPPGPIKILQLQERLNKLSEQQAQTWDALFYRPQEAYNTFKDLQSEVDAAYREYEEWIRQEVTTVHRRALEARTSLLLGQGHAALLMGRLSEACHIFQQALGVPGEEPGPTRTGLLAELGDICYQQGLFDDAVRYYKQVYDEVIVLADTFHRQAQGIDEKWADQRASYEKMAKDLWQLAAQSLGSLAGCALMLDDRAGFARYTGEAKELARVHGLQELYRQFRLNELKLRIISDATGEFTKELSDLAEETFTEDASIQIDLKLFLAERALSRGEKSGVDEAKRYLDEAEQRAEDNHLPFSKWSVMLARIGFFEALGQIDNAIQEAQELLRMTREANIQLWVQQALNALILAQLRSDDPAQRAQADQDIEELSKSGNSRYLAQALYARALRLTNEQRFEEAMRDIERAESCAVEGFHQRKLLLFAKFVLLVKMDRKEDALKQGYEAIRQFSEALVPPGEQLQAQWKDTLQHLEALYTGMASLLIEMAQPGYHRQAFDIAEKGKAQIMRQQLAWSGQRVSEASKESSKIDFDELRASLASESAALAMFGLGESKSWVFIVDSQHQEPQYYPINDLKIDTFKKWELAGQRDKVARQKLFNALPELSKLLLPPLREVVQHCKVLYLVPSALLYALPFAALSFTDGSYLIEHCALAYVPSIAVLHWCRSRYHGVAEHTCLALGVGAYEDCSFAEQAQAVAALPWAATELLPETTTATELLSKMQRFTVVHLSCHGVVNSRNPDILQASSLMLKDTLTAKQVFALYGATHLELAFLNACLSGGFQHQMSNEVGGFWQAFLQAGAAALIATLTLVDPVPAQQLALSFYKHWLAGKATKAEALRQAQLELLKPQLELPKERRKLYHWASHILIGDHR